MQRCLLQIYLHVVFRLRIFDIPIHIHYARRLLKDLLDLSGQLDLAFIIGPINFRDQSLQHRWTWWNLGNLDASAKRMGNLVQLRPQSARNFVALCPAVVPREQVYLNVSLIGLIA